ncbi:RabGAP/TBC [Saitoella complicata NRRL Y-17804]|nr:RabGAP/TBC [Saitoella complicata NRRL Y-17804]ODQ50794.1 RabGAP/TBC [Saitoella complicata NRRL Y-17804]
MTSPLDFPRTINDLRQAALNNTPTSVPRSLRWKLFLRVLPSYHPSSWSDAISRERARYAELKARYTAPGVVESGDPLSQDESSPWKERYADEELKETIIQDTQRTFPDIPFFRLPRTQQILLDVLFTYSKLNPDTSYRQGMHELLAPILFAVQGDALPPPSSTPDQDVLHHTCSETHVEADTYILFSKLMEHTKSFYLTTSTPENPAPIIATTNNIQNKLLPILDPDLHHHLTSLQIEPQIWGIRYLRLLFGREFGFSGLFGLWDALFADMSETGNLMVVEWVCVAMLMRIRSKLIGASYTETISLLLKYPVESESEPASYVREAIFLRENFSTTGGLRLVAKYTPVPVPSPTTSTTPTSSRTAIASGRLFDTLVSDVSRRAEKLGLNNTIRSAVQEVRKGVQTIQKEYDNNEHALLERFSPALALARPGNARGESSENLKGRDLANVLGESLKVLEGRVERDVEVERALEGIRRVRDTLSAARSPNASAVATPTGSAPTPAAAAAVPASTTLPSTVTASLSAPAPVPVPASKPSAYPARRLPTHPRRHQSRASLASSDFAFLLSGKGDEDDKNSKPKTAAAGSTGKKGVWGSGGDGEFDLGNLGKR